MDKTMKYLIFIFGIVICGILVLSILALMSDQKEEIYNKIIVVTDDIDSLKTKFDVAIVTPEIAEKIDYKHSLDYELGLYVNELELIKDKVYLDELSYVLTSCVDVIEYINNSDFDLSIVYEIEEGDNLNYQFFLNYNIFIVFVNQGEVDTNLVKFYRNRFMSVWVIYEPHNKGAYPFVESIVFTKDNIENINQIVKKHDETFNQVLASHRGSFKYRNNTIEAINHSIESGISIIEIDISFTREGVPILYHDGKIQFDSGPVDVNSISYNDLSKQKKFDYSYIKELSVVLNAYQEQIFLIDIKTSNYNCTKKLLELIDECGMTDNVLVFPNYEENFRAVREYKQKCFRVIVNFHVEYDSSITYNEFRKRMNFGNYIVSLNGGDYGFFSDFMKKSDRHMIWNIDYRTKKNNDYFETNAYSVDLR